LNITVWRLAFVADFGTQNFNLKTKFDMKTETSTNHENGNDANRLLAVRFIFGLLGTLFISLSVGWLAFYNGCEFHDYKWVWSESNLILSGQYLLNMLWGIVFVTSPVWWLGATILSGKLLLPKI
jgi:hypothetical protein